MILRQRATNSLVAWERLHLFPQPHQAPESLSNGKGKERQLFIHVDRPVTLLRVWNISTLQEIAKLNATQVVDFRLNSCILGWLALQRGRAKREDLMNKGLKRDEKG